MRGQVDSIESWGWVHCRLLDCGVFGLLCMVCKELLKVRVESSFYCLLASHGFILTLSWLGALPMNTVYGVLFRQSSILVHGSIKETGVGSLL